MASVARKRRWRRYPKLILGVVIFACSVGANPLLSEFGWDQHPQNYYLPRVIFFGLAIVLVLGFCRSASKEGFKKHPRAPRQAPTTDLANASLALGSEVERARSSGAMDRDSAYAFASGFLSPAASRSRVVETIALTGDHVTRTSTIEYRPDDTVKRYPTETFGFELRPTLRLIPILRFNKGQLVSNFSVQDAAGTKLPTLPHSDYLVLAGTCISTLLQAAVTGGDLDPDLSTAARKKYTRAETLLLSKCISSPTASTDQPEEDNGYLSPSEFDRRARNLLETLKTLVEVNSIEHAELLCAFATRVQSAYAIVIEASVPRDRHAIFEYTYTEKLVARDLPAQRIGVLDRLRSEARDLLGLDPVSLNIDVSRVKKCSSYHLRVTAPPGYYVGETWFHDLQTMQPISMAQPRNIYQRNRPYFRCPSPSGQSYAHLYTRGFEHSDSERPCLQVRFFERLPGSLGQAWVLALAVLAVVWIFGTSWHGTRSGRVGSSLGGIDPGALIFALPLALWALMGFGEKARGYASTLTSKLSILSSLMLAFAALILTLFITAGRISATTYWPSVALVTHKYWIVLLTAAVINCWWIGQTYLIRFWKWKQISTRVESEGDPTPGG